MRILLVAYLAIASDRKVREQACLSNFLTWTIAMPKKFLPFVDESLNSVKKKFVLAQVWCARQEVAVPARASGGTAGFYAVELSSCRVSNLVIHTFP